MTSKTAPRRPRGRPKMVDGQRGRSLTIRIPDDLRERAQAAAEAEGVDLSEWVRDRMEEGLK
jgi:predicted HicB family RNase H-like nuclease